RSSIEEHRGQRQLPHAPVCLEGSGQNLLDRRQRRNIPTTYRFYMEDAAEMQKALKEGCDGLVISCNIHPYMTHDEARAIANDLRKAE
ncbi:unnamed protein product, partial [Ectocarpus sp. 12 AP-2014]